MNYIAYGSNMIEEQMMYRCPDARLLGMGYLPGSRLEFYLHATVEHSHAKDAQVPVAVWEISSADERRLDHYEGYPSYYIKAERTVHMTGGSEIKGMIYLMNQKRIAPPTRDYYDGILRAYLALGFSSEIERVLKPALLRSLLRKS
ncbi:gamma-glutamylcyclotransferase family protein [Bacillota bacterium Meth-B3]